MHNLRKISWLLIVTFVFVTVAWSKITSGSEKAGPAVDPDKVTILHKAVDLDHDGTNEYLRIAREENPKDKIDIFLMAYRYDKPQKTWKKVGTLLLEKHPPMPIPIFKGVFTLDTLSDLTRNGIDEIITTTQSGENADMLKIRVWSYDHKNTTQPLSLLWKKDAPRGSLDIKKEGFTITEVIYDPKRPGDKYVVKTAMYKWDGKSFSPEK